MAMASARILVQSSRASGRQLHRRQPRNVGSGLLESAPRSSSLHTFSKFRPIALPKQGQSSTSLSLDLSSLAALESTKAGDMPPKEGWSKWEVMASAVIAAAATGSFLVASTMTSPSFSPKILQQRGGGGGGKPGGSSASPIPEPEEDEESNVSALVDESGGEPYQVSVQAVRGGRLTMEDEYFVAKGGQFAAVFDGHGGGKVSARLRDQLFKLVMENLRRCGELDDNSKYPSLSSYVAALRTAFQQIDHEVLADDTLQYQGSTAVAVWIHEGEDGHRTLLSANVGDSRAILSRKGRAVDLTRDHKPNDEREKARIMAMGETIEWDHYCKVHRVRNLSLSRAIGDRFAKPVVSGEVEIKHFPEAGEGDEFFLLASDGLWDVMSSQDVISFIHKRLYSKDNSFQGLLARRQTMSTAVAKEALRRGSGDNVCVVIVWLNDQPKAESLNDKPHQCIDE